MSSDRPLMPRMAHEGLRNVVSLGLAAAVAVLALIGYALIAPLHFTPDTVALTTFVFWIAYSLGFLILTHTTFGKADAATLRNWLTATNAQSRSLAIPATAAQWAILAVLAVALVLVLPGLLDSPLANALSFAVVITAWLVTVTAYAVHYARLNTQEPSLAFPGELGDQEVFADYYYLAAQLATTFSSSDVSILTTRARSVVTGQTYIGFAFSTFIIALLISVLFLSN
ncbi:MULTISPECIES: DUF1345 domain-containing protein [unclassified Microbacterium]|uniref:DUF1345 domain-containing protein n=1 Tax=unclassified Microbacterium TaxID=2609290 RepID=UPI00214C9AD3|nr:MULTISPECIES: DUF1345 domain-containing protein [unclassified Microbacterium]MCR2809074.1 DUF1345 domain-containing protein [Microbacterium sp. zg.B185]WIM20230.1 DUF1345 domain-containing protein [Microbacterium sp. zg-B185]